MTNLVTFPGLGISLNISSIAFTIFGLPIYWYGVCITLGVFLAMLMAFKQAKSFGISNNRMIDVIMVSLIVAIIGGRAYYVVFTDESYPTFMDLINLRGGGIAIYGAIIAGFVSAAVCCKWRKVPLLPMFDLAGIGFLIGQTCGRWGNFFNQEVFGVNTNLPWGMYSEETNRYLSYHSETLAAGGVIVDPTLPVHPTFLYESLWCALGFILVFAYRKHRKFHGELFLFYIIWYGIGRFFIEGLRTDSLWGFGLRVSQALAAVSVLIAVPIWLMARVRAGKKKLIIPVLPTSSIMHFKDENGTKHSATVSWSEDKEEPSHSEKIKIAKENFAKEKTETPVEDENASDDSSNIP